MYYYNLGQYFSDVAHEYAQQTALRYLDHSYNYKNLDNTVTSIAQLLITNGCHRGDVIAIGNNKHYLSYSLMLACLRLGITYVNIDTASPLERNARILKACEVKLLFFDSLKYVQSMTDLTKKADCKLIYLNKELLSEATDKELLQQKNLMAKVDGSCIAYIMFTSGSTGIPKGVAVTHQNVLHFIHWGQQRFNISEQDNFANLSPMYFDNSVFDFYIGLFSGATISPIHRELLTSPYELISYVKDMQCTIWFSVPSLLIYLNTMKAIISEELPLLQTIIFGGEGYPKSELFKLYREFASQANLINVYGPTECTCICSAYTLTDEDFSDMEGLPPLGKLNQNFDYLILDEQNNESNTGELCLIGPNVAAGYFNDEIRTTLSFKTLVDPKRYMKRMYQTGDLVNKHNNILYFLGRKDNQIKHMGYRIELEEIETAVNTLTGIIQVAVVYKQVNVAFGKIYCYVQSNSQFIEKNAMQQLALKLPDYMLPYKIVILDNLPKNPNGKIDRNTLKDL